jgi:hypothetical protein
MTDSAQDDDTVLDKDTAQGNNTVHANNTVQDNDATQDNDTAAAPADTKAAGEAEVTGEAGQADDLDETKRKFREALERKHQAHARETGSAGGRGTVKGKGAQGPATSRRSFRRKSG